MQRRRRYTNLKYSDTEWLYHRKLSLIKEEHFEKYQCLPKLWPDESLLSPLGNLSRVYLKTPNVTGSEEFLRWARHFFAGILTYFKEKWCGAAWKGPLSGFVGSSQIHPSFSDDFRYGSLCKPTWVKHIPMWMLWRLCEREIERWQPHLPDSDYCLTTISRKASKAGFPSAFNAF